MTKGERIERLEKNGYSPRRIFGNWYFVRPYSGSYCGNNLLKRVLKHTRIIVKIKSDLFEINNKAIKPKGEYRT